MRHAILAAILLLGLAPRPGMAADAAPLALAAHRAVYALTLQSARGNVVAATGNMAYEVTDACDAWAVRQRLKMTLTNRDGQDIEMVSDYTTWESKDGLRLRFRLRQTTEDAVSSELSGKATLSRIGGPGWRPTTCRRTPPRTCRPARCSRWRIPQGCWRRHATARNSSPCRCSTAPARTAHRTPAWRSAAGTSRRQANTRCWPGCRARECISASSIAASHALMPDYEVGMRYWANGIADDLSMDFGTFVMHGTLTSLVLPARPGC